MNTKYTNKPEEFQHFVIDENRICYPDHEFIIHLHEPRVFIRYLLDDSIGVDFNEWFKSIAFIQWLDGKPSEAEQKKLLVKAWNFLCIEERIMEDEEENFY